MAKVRVQMMIDLETGIYDITFANVTNPGSDMDILKVLKVCDRIIMNTEQKVKKGDVMGLYTEGFEHN